MTSSFRDWAAKQTDHPREVIDAALAHVVPNKVEAAYARSDVFQRRRLLMNDWAGRLGGHTEDSTRALIRCCGRESSGRLARHSDGDIGDPTRDESSGVSRTRSRESSR